MILLGYDWSAILLGTLYASLGLLIAVIAYRKLIHYLDKGRPQPKNFCVLYNLQEEPASGELTFYFTTEAPVEYSLLILDQDMKSIVEIKTDTAKSGGNIVRFDSASLANGEYYYCLQTENQKTMKKMRIANV